MEVKVYAQQTSRAGHRAPAGSDGDDFKTFTGSEAELLAEAAQLACRGVRKAATSFGSRAAAAIREAVEFETLDRGLAARERAKDKLLSAWAAESPSAMYERAKVELPADFSDDELADWCESRALAEALRELSA